MAITSPAASVAPAVAPPSVPLRVGSLSLLLVLLVMVPVVGAWSSVMAVSASATVGAWVSML